MKYILTILTIAFAMNLNAQDLPKGLTEYEKSVYQDFILNPQNYFQTDSPDPPPGPVRTMAEWEELQALQITWVSTAAHRIILREIVRYSVDECEVWILCGTSGGNDSNSIKTYLTSGGVTLTNVRFLQIPTNSIWCRDYGPWTVYSNDYDTLRIVDWIYNRPSRPQDNQSPVFIAQYMNAPIHQTIQAPNDLINTGGNFMVDGHGTGFASKLVLNENPGKTPAQIDAIMNLYMGLDRYIKMDPLPFDAIDHIDMHIKLLDEETLLVGQYPIGVSNGPQIEQNLNYVLDNFATAFGKIYKVVRIPMPPTPGGQYPPQTSTLYTYTNSVIVNKTVLVPIYNFSQDAAALQVYRDAMPGYKIIGIDCNAIIGSLGAIHCITKEIGVNEPVFISHSAIRDTNTTSPLEVKAYVGTKSGVQSASLYYRTDTTVAYSQINMTVSNDTFFATIPSQTIGTNVYYYISATSNSGRTVNKPLPAPQGYMRFVRDTPTNIGGSSTLANGFELSQNFPNPFNPTTNINFTLPGNSYVKLEVFDISGRLVQELVNDFRMAGSHEVNFNANEISSGIYFYRLTTPNFTDVKKMMFVK